MTENVHIQQTVALTNAQVFNVAVNESVNITDMLRLAVGSQQTIQRHVCS